MLYTAFLTWRSAATGEQRREALGRRAMYQFPPGLKVLAEYWVSGPTAVVAVFEAEGYAPIMKLTLDWEDVFDIAVYTATTAQEGLRIGAQMMQQAVAS